MRKLLLALIALFLCSTLGKAQTVLNGDFESWDTLDYEDLNSTFWVTGNRFWVPDERVAVISKVNGYLSAHAIRLEVKTSPAGDTLTPFLANELDGISDGEGGKPYSEGLPTAYKGFYRHNLLNNDTAQIVLILKKDGAVLSSDTIRFTGSQPSFTEFNLPLNLSDKPDTVFTYALIGNPEEDVLGTPGSWLELDSLNLFIEGTARLLPEGDFERWDTLDYDIPEDWEIYNQAYPGAVVRTTDRNSGIYALQLTTLVDSFFMDTIVARVSSELITIGTEAVDMLDSISFSYKFSNIATDFAHVAMQYFSASNIPLGAPIKIYLGASSAYNRVAFSLNGRPATAEKLKIDFASSATDMGPAKPGSVFTVDDIEVKRRAVSVNDITKLMAAVYPNPTNGILKVSAKSILSYSVKDITGRALLIGDTRDGVINVAGIAPGTYLLLLTDKEGKSQSVMFNKQ